MEDLMITEALLNEGLANLTISALSLNTWFGVVNGTVTKQFSVYLFKHKLNFFLPYGLCLLFAIPIVLLGLIAQYKNGVSAIDGGILQILMTTTGRTELEKRAMRGCLGGYENVPEELKQLEVRFGELLSDGDENRERLTAHDHSIQETTAPESDLDGENGTIDSNGEPDEAEEQNHHSIEMSEEPSTPTLVSGAATQAPRPGLLRRAGFGTWEETRPLVKGVRYVGITGLWMIVTNKYTCKENVTLEFILGQGDLKYG